MDSAARHVNVASLASAVDPRFKHLQFRKLGARSLVHADLEERAQQIHVKNAHAQELATVAQEELLLPDLVSGGEPSPAKLTEVETRVTDFC